ncbi:hypothetical protein bcgnr5376_48910 [Bacillus cereus]
MLIRISPIPLNIFLSCERAVTLVTVSFFVIIKKMEKTKKGEEVNE